MTTWDIELEVNVPTTSTEQSLGELRNTLVDTFITNALSVTENTTDGFTWNLGGRVGYMDFNSILETIATAHRDYSFVIDYNSDDLLSAGHTIWSNGKMVVNDFQEDMTYDQYRACGFDAESWLMNYAYDEDDRWELVDDADTSTLLLNELHESLLDEHGLDDEDEILQAIAEHPNYVAVTS